MTTIPIRRALISTYDKTDVVKLGQALIANGVEIVSTGSTGQTLRDAGLDVTDIAEVTGFAEMLDGRVKTLHPAVHAALLADQGNPRHVAQLAEAKYRPIDLVVCNLYPFADTVADPNVDDATAIEMIDIGGPTMIRAAAKNFSSVTVVVSPTQYPALIDAVTADGGVGQTERRRLAAEAFEHVRVYDEQIAEWFARDDAEPAAFGERFTTSGRRVTSLRYGENPHQNAAVYATNPTWGVAAAEVLGGKALSYNNYIDTDAAWLMATEFDQPCVAIIKHTNPAGLAVADRVSLAYPKALAGDPVSAFGGIVAANQPIDVATAEQIVKVFTEVVIAPGYSNDALQVLRTKKNLRILQTAVDRPSSVTVRSISGGVLCQDSDIAPQTPATWTVPTTAKPDTDTLAELTFAWRVVKHVKSNAIVLTKDRAVVGVGAGQMSRVDSVELSVRKSDGRANGAVLASDAFFPFCDGPDAAIAAGVAAIIQPGGSKRDDETIQACEEAGIPMVMTGRRHFRH